MRPNINLAQPSHQRGTVLVRIPPPAPLPDSLFNTHCEVVHGEPARPDTIHGTRLCTAKEQVLDGAHVERANAATSLQRGVMNMDRDSCRVEVLGRSQKVEV